jgi:hypothetical protein
MDPLGDSLEEQLYRLNAFARGYGLIGKTPFPAQVIMQVSGGAKLEAEGAYWTAKRVWIDKKHLAVCQCVLHDVEAPCACRVYEWAIYQIEGIPEFAPNFAFFEKVDVKK